MSPLGRALLIVKLAAMVLMAVTLLTLFWMIAAARCSECNVCPCRPLCDCRFTGCDCQVDTRCPAKEVK